MTVKMLDQSSRWNYKILSKVLLRLSMAAVALHFLSTLYSHHNAHFEFYQNESENLVQYGEPSSLRNRIFFLETSGRGDLSLRAACAVESAAKENPHRPVQVIVFNLTTQTSSPNWSILGKYTNIRVHGLSMDSYFNNTPFQHWYEGGLWNTSPYRVAHLSDYLRIVSLWKGGGVYMDTDFVVRRLLPNLTDFSCNESPDATSNGVIALRVDHPLLDVLVQEMATSYDPNAWGHNGPKALRRSLSKLCNEKRLQLMTPQKCAGFTLLPAKDFYPIFFSDWKQFFAPSTPEILKLVNDSYAIHVWNKFSFGAKVKVGSSQLYAVEAAQHCPHVYAAAGSEF